MGRTRKESGHAAPGGSRWPSLGGSIWVTLPGSVWATPGGSASPTPVAQYRVAADTEVPSTGLCRVYARLSPLSGTKNRVFNLLGFSVGGGHAEAGSRAKASAWRRTGGAR